ncbi:hypothetical protein ACFQYP_21680 [Nonomuraea antimicrobica]
MLEAGTLARLAVPTMEQDLLLAPESGVPVVQKLLAPDDIPVLLDTAEPRVSGYCHNALDVSHIATPAVLAAALDSSDLLTESGSLNILRWHPVGLGLYHTPYGGPTRRGGGRWPAGWSRSRRSWGWAWCPASTTSSASTRCTGWGCRTARRSGS